MSNINNHTNTNDIYFSNLETNIIVIISKYVNIINQYLKICNDSIIIQDNTYKKFVIKRGINTLANVYKLLLLYTKNFNYSSFNTEKAATYYIEFIGQISDENHSFLELSSKDACLFVYKKTIYEIDNEIRKELVVDENLNKINKKLSLFINIYNNLLIRLLDNNSLIDTIKYSNTELQIIINKITKIYVENDDNYLFNKLESIEIFSKNFKKNDILNYIEIFIKKIKKINTTTNTTELELLLLNNDLYSNSPIKFINHILSNILSIK
jgi:hypothetical protein